MSYIINKTDGTVLTEIVDGTIDQVTSDLTLIGKNSSNYGEFFNENFVKLLENFSNTSAPTNPITGQLWFDTTENRLKIYDGTGFRVSGGTVVSSTVPSGLVQGDIWIDSIRKQLFFYDGTQLTLAGPPYTNQQGLTGITIESILDTNQLSHTVALQYVSQSLIGIWSKDEFTPATSIVGFSGKVYKGFTMGTLSGAEFRVTAQRARELIATDGSIKTAESFLSKTENAATTGNFTILNTKPLVLGTGQNWEVQVLSGNMNIVSNNSGQEFSVKTKSSGSPVDALKIKATTQRVGIFAEDPQATLDVNGDVIIRGDLTIEGSTTTINTTVISVEDATMELGVTAVPSDNSADNGGIILKGTTDKTIIWNKDISDIARSNWNFSENISLSTGKTFKINNVDVLSSTSLGNTVEAAPGLRTLGNLLSLTVDNINVNDNTISSTDTNGDIVLSPNGIGKVSVASSRISNLANPVDPTDAVNLQYFQQYVTAFPLGTTMDITTLSSATPLLWNQIATILEDIFPASEHPTGTICKVYTNRQTVSYPSINITKAGPGSGATFEANFVSVNKGALQENQSVLQDFGVNAINAGDATISYVRRVFVFTVDAAAWTYSNDFAATTLPT